jgi:hypothetical protein
MQETNQSRFGTTWSKDHFDGEIAFLHMRDEFEKVMAKYSDEVHESAYLFGGQSVQMRIVGDELADHFGRPFSHLRTSDLGLVSPQLTIDLWDANKAIQDSQRQSMPDDLKWTELTVRSADERYIGQRLPHTFSCFDRKAGHIAASIAWHDRIFIYERAKPLARVLLEWHNDQATQMIHAGLVARNGKGILFAGKSGTGKSTTSLACVCAGLDYLGEDYVGLQRGQDGRFIGHSVYNSVFLKTVHLVRFPELIPYAIKGRPPREEKSVIILSQVFPERLERVVPIHALALPRVIDTSMSKFRRASKGEALLALGPSSLLQIPNRGLGVRGFQTLANLVEEVPCYWLELGSDLVATAHQVEELIEGLDCRRVA